MLTCELVGIRIDEAAKSPILLLRELAAPGRVIEIWFGAIEAGSIAMVEQGITPERPMTHDLFGALLSSQHLTLNSVRITDLVDGIFIAELALSDGTRLDCRPSDAIALSVRLESVILVAETVFDQAGFVPEIEISELDPETEIAAFKSFLEDLKPEDF
jgi:bifunctional DNase/RNase